MKYYKILAGVVGTFIVFWLIHSIIVNTKILNLQRETARTIANQNVENDEE